MKKKCILLIEDDPLIAHLVCHLLRFYTVDVATEGKEGLLLVENSSPDLILCDISLKDINGYEVAKALKSNEKFKAIPVLALSALGYEDAEKALLAGFDGYILKPFDPLEFLKKIEQYL